MKRYEVKNDSLVLNEEILRSDIITYFENNESDFVEVIEELNCINDILQDDVIYSMEELDELYAGTEPSEVLRRAFFGYDGDDSCISTGPEDSEYAPFNPNREYFYFNGYGNLVSTDDKAGAYSDRLDDYFVDELIENYRKISSLPEEVKDIIEQIEALEEEAE